MRYDLRSTTDYLSPGLVRRLATEQSTIPGVPGLTVDRVLLDAYPTLHAVDALMLVCAVYDDVKDELGRVLQARADDRAQLDAWTLEAAEHNRGLHPHDPAFRTVIGRVDGAGRLLVGPLPGPGPRPRKVDLPPWLSGPAVTLFGPPDDAKMCIHAMNALHRRRPDEAPIVAELVDGSGLVPRWGADSEDSKTPMVGDLLAAIDNLRGCYDGSLRLEQGGRSLQILSDRPSVPIKRIPGLALPAATHQLRGNPLPLHLLDFVLHAFHNRRCAEALAFYVPKLENEEEAAYVAALVRNTEARLAAFDRAATPGRVRLFLVFETPRAIFRIREMADVLHPYFAGGSLGWHDFLAATARLFRHDPSYRIPIKADPDIVIRHIRESHRLLATALEPLGAVRIGGMYGTLFEEGNPASFRVSMTGFVRDVVTQLRRGLDGFWVAHPDFVRIGIALVEAWRRGAATLEALIAALVPDPAERAPLLAFVRGPDVDGLEPDDPLYLRRVLAADAAHSDLRNDDPEEVRYNVFQAVQYLAAWLSGTGCVALPATLPDGAGQPVFVRVMDDLATTERSRWELWAEVHHGRFAVERFEAILEEELTFVREGRATATKRVQVAWSGEAARWYPIAGRLLHRLVTAANPPEAVTELLMPFTLAPVRAAVDPWDVARGFCPRLG